MLIQNSSPGSYDFQPNGLNVVVGGLTLSKITNEMFLISNVRIKPEYRGNGFGYEMLRELIAEAKRNKIPNLKLIVNRNNFRAYRLYKKCGFKTTNSIFQIRVMQLSLSSRRFGKF